MGPEIIARPGPSQPVIVTYGGVAGEHLDSCYHEACDTIKNINPELLKEISGALAYATVSFTMARQD